MDLDLLIREAGGLRRLAVELVGESAADDVVQDALIAGVRSAPADDGSIRPWLARVVRNLAAGRHRASARRTARDREAARPERLPSASDLVERMDVQRVVAEEVLALAEPYRSAILAVHFEGASAEEFARDRDVPGATVRSWTKRGLDTLRARLDRRFGGDRGAWTACLLPLTRPEAVVVPLAIGSGLMLKKLVASAAVVVLALLVLWAVLGIGGRDDHVAEFAGPIPLELETPEPRSALDRAPAVVEAGPRDEVFVAAEPGVPPQLTGRVVWTPGREPAVGIGVWVAHHARPDLGVPLCVVTDTEGRFRVDSPGLGQFEVSIDRNTELRPVPVALDKTREIKLEVPRGHRVVGRVLDRSGSPVVGAEVCVAGSGLWSRCVARSASDGSYVIEHMGLGSRLFARATGHSPSGSYMLENHRLPGLVGPYSLDLWLGGAPGRVEGRILDAAGHALPDIQVVLRSSDEAVTDPAGVRAVVRVVENVKSDPLGNFVVRDLRPGRHVLEVHSRPRTSLMTTVEVRSNRVSRADIVLPGTARVFGRITDTAGSPCVGALVQATTLDGPKASTWIMADEEGRYGTGFVPAGRVRLQVRHARGSQQLDAEFAHGGAREWSPVLGATELIRGRVVDRRGQPIGGVQVSTGQNQKSEVLTDVSGRFALAVKTGQVSRVEVWCGESVCAWRDVRAGDADIEIVFEVPSARIVGRILDLNGVPVEGLAVECGGASTRPDAEGRFESQLLPSGLHSVCVSPYGVGTCHLLTVDLAAGETESVGDLVLPGRGALVVSLHPREDVDPYRVELVASRSGAPNQVVTSRGANVGGDWRAEGLPEGEYLVYAEGGGVAMSETRVAIRADESTSVDLDLYFGSPVRVALRGDRLGTCSIEVRNEAGDLVGTREYDTSYALEYRMRLRAGWYELLVNAADGRSGRERIEIATDATAEKVVAIDVD